MGIWTLAVFLIVKFPSCSDNLLLLPKMLTHSLQSGRGGTAYLALVYLASQGGLRPLDGLRAGHVISFGPPRNN